MRFEVKRKESICKQLSREFGGKWKYKVGTWWCDDNKRNVMRVAGCLCDGDCGHPSQYYLYGDGIPKRLFL